MSLNVLLIQSTSLCLFNLGNDICNLRFTACNDVEKNADSVDLVDVNF